MLDAPRKSTGFVAVCLRRIAMQPILVAVTLTFESDRSVGLRLAESGLEMPK